MTLETRVARLEAKIKNTDEQQMIWVLFHRDSAEEMRTIRCGDQIWTRVEGEGESTFKARARAAAKPVGSGSIVVVLIAESP